MAREKSIADIIRQRNRIQQELINTAPIASSTAMRYRTASNVADKYVTNIRKRYGSDIGNNGRWNNVAYKRVPQRVYMGLSNG